MMAADRAAMLMVQAHVNKAYKADAWPNHTTSAENPAVQTASVLDINSLLSIKVGQQEISMGGL
jgi:hypothetical protein